MIRVTDLIKQANGTRILRGVSFEVAPQGWHCLSASVLVSAPDRPRQRHRSADPRAARTATKSGKRSPGVTGIRRPKGQGAALSGIAFRRRATTRGYRARAGDAPGTLNVRRTNQCARSKAQRRTAFTVARLCYP